MTVPKFSGISNSFHAELKQRVSSYFEEVGRSTTGDYKIFIKAVVLMLAFCAIYIHLIFFTPPLAFAIIECLVLGAVVASIGFNVMHDGAHGSFSKYKWLNRIAALSLNILGGNNFMWNMKHNVIHHAYTNVEGVDDDINAGPLLRLAAGQKRLKVHKYQHIYFGVLYSLLYIYWIFVSDYIKYFARKIGPVPIKKMSIGDHLTFWGFKLFHYFLFIGIPVYMLGFSTWLIGFLIFTLFAGFVLSIVFQLAHTVEHTSFPAANIETGKMEDEWAIHQLKTTANFATRNKLISWYVGGLNFQVEHHLFPKISHVHYPAISKIIKKACEDYGIPYIEYPKMRMAVASHVNYLKHLGRG